MHCKLDLAARHKVEGLQRRLRHLRLVGARLGGWPRPRGLDAVFQIRRDAQEPLRQAAEVARVIRLLTVKRQKPRYEAVLRQCVQRPKVPVLCCPLQLVEDGGLGVLIDLRLAVVAQPAVRAGARLLRRRRAGSRLCRLVALHGRCRRRVPGPR